MNTQNNDTKKRSFYDILKYIMIILIILQFAPMVISNLWKSIHQGVAPTSKVGYLKISGMITDSAFYIKCLKDFEKNDAIKGLLIKVDSPGGLPGSSQAIAHEIRRFKRKKPVVVHVENVCASAAYYLASEADRILANSSSLIGSVGVLMELPNVKGFLDHWNVKVTYLQSGTYKTAGSMNKEMSKIEEKYLQDLTNNAYEQFVTDVARARGLDEKARTIWADGKLFTGSQALDLKLIDQLGSYSDALDVIKELTGIAGEVDLVTSKKQKGGIMRLLMGSEDYGSEASLSSQTAQFLYGVYKSFLLQLSAEQQAKLLQ